MLYKKSKKIYDVSYVTRLSIVQLYITFFMFSTTFFTFFVKKYTFLVLFYLLLVSFLTKIIQYFFWIHFDFFRAIKNCLITIISFSDYNRLIISVVFVIELLNFFFIKNSSLIHPYSPFRRCILN